MAHKHIYPSAPGQIPAHQAQRPERRTKNPEARQCLAHGLVAHKLFSWSHQLKGANPPKY